MCGTALKTLPALLVPLAVAWVAAADGIAIAPVVAVASVVAIAVILVVDAGRTTRWDPPLLWLGALVGWAAVVSALRPVALITAAWSIASGVVALSLAFIARTPRGGAWARVAVIAAGAVTAAWLVVERIMRGERPGGPFGNPNLAGTVALLGLVLVPWLRARAASRAVLAAVLISGVLSSSSRGALLATLAVGIVWMSAAVAPRTRRLALVGAAVVAVGLGVRLVLDRDPLRFERVQLWGVAIRTALAELPFGCGPGGYVDAALPHNFPRTDGFARYHRVPGLAESDPLQLAAALGAPGIVLAVGVCLSALAALRRGGLRGIGVATALVVSLAVNTQLAAPAVAWVAALAVAGAMPRARGRRLTLSRPLAGAVALAIGVPTAVSLMWPRGGLGEDPARLLGEADVLAHSATGDGALADATALAWRATRLEPRSARAWRLLGSLSLQRAKLDGEAALAEDAVSSYRHARAVNPLDAWAAFGEGCALHALGRAREAREALHAAIDLEPNFVGAWTELAVIALESGEIAAARNALGHAERSSHLASRAEFVSSYEWELAAADPRLLARLRAATGSRR